VQYCVFLLREIICSPEFNEINMQFNSPSVKVSCLVLFLLSIAISLKAQTKDTTVYKFGAGVEFNYRTVFDNPAETDIVISPVFQYYTGAFSIYAGPSFQTNVIKCEHKNKYGFKAGFSFSFPAHKNTRVKGYVKTEFNYMGIWKEQTYYDHAIPNIDIPVTVMEKRLNYLITYRAGITCRFLKRFFIGINVGPAILIEEDYSIYSKDARVYPIVSYNPAFTEELQLGVKF
jgi:hypothetical protein